MQCFYLTQHNVPFLYAVIKGKSKAVKSNDRDCLAKDISSNKTITEFSFHQIDYGKCCMLSDIFLFKCCFSRQQFQFVSKLIGIISKNKRLDDAFDMVWALTSIRSEKDIYISKIFFRTLLNDIRSIEEFWSFVVLLGHHYEVDKWVHIFRVNFLRLIYWAECWTFWNRNSIFWRMCLLGEKNTIWNVKISQWSQWYKIAHVTTKRTGKRIRQYSTRQHGSFQAIKNPK